MREPGLSLDFAPNSPKSQRSEAPQNSPLAPYASNQTLENRLDSTEVKRPNPISPENLIRKSLEGTLGDIHKHIHHPRERESDVQAVNYSEMVNRSEHGTTLARANYN